MANSEPEIDPQVLLQQRDDLRRMQAQIAMLMREVDEKLKQAGVEASVPDPSKPMPNSAIESAVVQVESYPSTTADKRRRPVRQLVLDALEDLGWLAYSREVALHAKARFGREIPSTRFGSLAKDEIQSFRASTNRPVWICYGLTHDRHMPIKRLLARSDWPLEQRIVAPTSGRVQHLKITAALAQIALDAEQSAADPEMLRIIAADHARDLPGIQFRRGQFDLEGWRNVALGLLEELLPKDEEARRESAARLEKRGELIQLFGAPDLENLEPGPGERMSEG